jgi:CHAD domain-containing protein
LQDPLVSEMPEKTNPESKTRGDPGIYSFAATVLVRSVEALQKEIEGVRTSEDIEFIHRMRVASRRLRSSLGVFNGSLPNKKQIEWMRTIRQLTRALGEARDTDVQIELITQVLEGVKDQKYRPGINRILLRLTQQREELQQDVQGSLEELEKSKACSQIISRLSATLIEPREYSPALYQLAYTIINEKLNDFLSFEVYLRQPDNTAMLHAMRIAAKRLRYAMEIFAPIYPDELTQPLQAARKSQQILGDIHDCDVWITFLPGFEEKERKRIQKFYGHNRPLYRITPGVKYFLENRTTAREKAYRDFLKVWRKWREQEIWLSLRETILLAVPPQPVPQPSSPEVVLEDSSEGMESP